MHRLQISLKPLLTHYSLTRDAIFLNYVNAHNSLFGILVCLHMGDSRGAYVFLILLKYWVTNWHIYGRPGRIKSQSSQVWVHTTTVLSSKERAVMCFLHVSVRLPPQVSPTYILSYLTMRRK